MTDIALTTRHGTALGSTSRTVCWTILMAVPWVGVSTWSQRTQLFQLQQLSPIRPSLGMISTLITARHQFGRERPSDRSHTARETADCAAAWRRAGSVEESDRKPQTGGRLGATGRRFATLSSVPLRPRLTELEGKASLHGDEGGVVYCQTRGVEDGSR